MITSLFHIIYPANIQLVEYFSHSSGFGLADAGQKNECHCLMKLLPEDR